MNKVDLSIIIVSWNVKDKLRENLQALHASTGELNFEIFVVDNDSADGTAEMVASEFPWINLIANKENLGFAKANNQAIVSARGDYILLLNPDMKPAPDTMVKMVDWMRINPQAAIAGCHLINETGITVKHVRRFPAFADQLAIVLKLPHLFSGILGRYLREDFDYTQPARVDSVRGGFFMLRKETVRDIGLLDEDYFIWFEEVDYCRRAEKKGLEVWYTPVSECVDYVGQSFKQVKRGTTQKYFQDSMLKYFKKWHPGWQYWILKSAWPIGRTAAVLAEKIKVRPTAKT
ncbi:glycosyltransferase family 2 protein [Candidatus Falkowbacteria bacterium]|nr:glycosyltransferase family 2 protein [Candidatus Falkowbacteria bacterium]